MLVRIFPCKYSLQSYYQAITLTLGVSTKLFAFFCGYQEHTLSSRSSWTLNGASSVANTVPVGICLGPSRPHQEHTLFSRSSWTLNVVTQQWVTQVRLFPHKYSLQYHYQVVTLTLGVPTELFAFFYGYQEYIFSLWSSLTLNRASWVANMTPVGL